ncbi:Adenosylhomocysteinase [Thelohanellus kitauei]|uniref:Adenosylhomocysteinase n=1 Tax=Thelohanellus kitauei TaxID=669202 RepID=A0A0C2JV95_THEKT|nr:Adenosylhomocysteinase [Thelohanellus kitauei]
MKDNVLLGNIGQYDLELDVEWILKNAVSHVPIGRQFDKYTFKSGKSVILLAQGRLVHLSCAEGHPCFVMSATFSNMFLAAIELFMSLPTKYPNGIHFLPKKLDEQIAKAHLVALGGKLTKLTQEQANYIGVPIDGPFKRDDYRY